MISHKHKTIFVHIPKCGGQSIEHMFLYDLGLSWKDKSKLMMRKKNKHELGPTKLGHLIALDYVDCNYIDINLYETYYKFSIVRNPLQRLQSAYSYLGYKNLVSFSYFINEIVAENILHRGPKYWYLRPQVDFILDSDSKLLVDDIFKIESIAQSVETIIDRSGLQIRELPHINQSSQISLGSQIVRSAKLIINDKLKLSTFSERHNIACNYDTSLMIKKLYAADFEYLKYK